MRVAFCIGPGCCATISTDKVHGRIAQRCEPCRYEHRRNAFNASKRKWRRRMGMKERKPAAPKPKRRLIRFAGYDREDRI